MSRNPKLRNRSGLFGIDLMGRWVGIIGGRFVRSLILVLVLPANAFSGSVYFYHWGKEPGNKAIMNQKDSTPFTQELLDRITAWQDKKDLAWRGFYVAGDPYSAAQFGNDLIVVEVKAEGQGGVHLTNGVYHVIDQAPKDPTSIILHRASPRLAEKIPEILKSSQFNFTLQA